MVYVAPKTHTAVPELCQLALTASPAIKYSNFCFLFFLEEYSFVSSLTYLLYTLLISNYFSILIGLWSPYDWKRLCTLQDKNSIKAATRKTALA